MPVFNTVVAVIANVEAESPKAAVAKLARSVECAGFEVYDHGTSGHVGRSAFEAEEGTEPVQLP